MPSGKKIRRRLKQKAKLAAIPLTPHEAIEVEKCDNGWWVPGDEFSAVDRYSYDMEILRKGLRRTRASGSNPLFVKKANFVKIDHAIIAMFHNNSDDGGIPIPAPVSEDLIEAVTTAVCLLRSKWQEIYKEYDWCMDDAASRVLAQVRQDVDGVVAPHYDSSEHTVLILTDTEQSAYFRRAKARYQYGEYEASIADVNDFIVSCLAWARAAEGPPPYQMLAEAMFDRAKATALQGDYHGAHVDLRASCAGVRLRLSVAEEWSDDLLNNLQNKVATLLYVMAQAKILADAPRPLFSSEERRRIESELLIGFSSKAGSVCVGCGAKASEVVKLYVCGGCKRVKWCSRSCQKKCWSEHRGECLIEHVRCSEEFVRNKVTLGRGCALLFSSLGPALFLVDDDEDGSPLFSMLSNDNAHFSPVNS